MDFQFDATADVRRLKFLNMIDEHSRLCLAVRVGRRCKVKEVVSVLEELNSLYPAPAFIQSNNGPEFIAQAPRDWCEASATTSTACIAPGSTWEKGFAESFNGRFRDEFLKTELFATAPEALIQADRWRWTYNTLSRIRPSRAAQQGVVACPHPPALTRPGLTMGVTSNQLPTIDKLAKRLQRVNCHCQQQHQKFPLITLDLGNWSGISSGYGVSTADFFKEHSESVSPKVAWRPSSRRALRMSGT